MRINAGPSLAQLKAQLIEQVDREAEAARLRFVTPGAGQALEYQATEAEARAYLADPSPGGKPWPWLEAERAAQGGTPTLAAIAAEVAAQADAWVAVGSAIKQLRRAAKLAIEGATTVAGSRAASSVTWPAP